MSVQAIVTVGSKGFVFTEGQEEFLGQRHLEHKMGIQISSAGEREREYLDMDV